MAQSGFTPISLYYSTTAAATPTSGNLTDGELAINTNDGKLFYKDSSGVVQTIASKSTGSVAGATTQVIYNNAGAYAGSANMTFDGTKLTVGGLKDSALTSGRVTYASTSGELVDSANLTFNGTTLTAGGLTTAGTTSTSALNATGTVNLAGLTASRAIFTDASKNLVSNAITGTGNVVMSASPTLTGTVTAAAITASGAVSAGSLSTSGSVTATGTVSGATLSGAVSATTINASGNTTLANFTASGTASFTSTGAVKVPVGTTAQQPTPATGMIRYNSSNGQFEGYYASSWGQIGGGATGGGGNQVFVLNDQTVTVDYTIPTGKNASSAGPVTIDTGITVTVPTDSTWVIV